MSSTKTKVLICPYCGDTQSATERCRACGGLFEPLSRQASHNAMGPWYVRDEKRPFQPGASYETIVKLIEREIITRYTILRSPTTKQFWTVARRVPGIAHLLGYCHNCDASVTKDDHGCPSCGVPFGAYLDRNYLGLPEVKPLPWEAPIIDEGRGGNVGAAMRGFAPSNGAEPVDFRRAAEPMGLSSFASDDELRGMASRPVYSPAPPPTAGDAMPASENGAAHEHVDAVAMSSPQPFSAPSAGAAAAAAGGPPIGDGRALTVDSANSVAARSMQRRLQRQQSQIRLLMIVLGMVSVLAIVVIIAMLVRNAKVGAGDTKPSDANAAANSNGAVPSDANGATKKESIAAPQPEERGEPLDESQPPTSLPANDLDAPAVSAKNDIADQYAVAEALLIEGKKEDRPLKDRIVDVEKAVDAMKAIHDKAAASDKPADLVKTLAEAQRLLERLKLQEFFP